MIGRTHAFIGHMDVDLCIYDTYVVHKLPNTETQVPLQSLSLLTVSKTSQAKTDK